MVREVLNIYRLIQYAITGRSRSAVMQAGVKVTVEPFRIDENHGDIVHPCIRYIKEGFEGYKWWMVYTPYYNADASIENPILCYSDSQDSVPPTEWKFYCLVNEKPVDGYNSDPNLLYHNGRLYVYWRENILTNRQRYTYSRATFCAIVGNKTVRKLETPILVAEQEHEDPECCPTFMVSENGELHAYAMHLQFFSPKVRNMRQPWSKLLTQVINVLDLLGAYSQQKSFGIAIWRGSKDASEKCQYDKTVQFVNKNNLWRPWHMDFFDYEGRRYAIVQTNMCNADIALAWSNDQEHFIFFPKPLITNYSIDKLGIYKPTALVIDGIFYLYYTAQDKENRALNKLYMTKMSFSKLIESLQ